MNTVVYLQFQIAEMAICSVVKAFLQLVIETVGIDEAVKRIVGPAGIGRQLVVASASRHVQHRLGALPGRFEQQTL